MTVFVLLCGGAAYGLWRASERSGLLLPVAVAFAVRALCVLITHVVTTANGHHGFLYVDDHGYADDGRILATGWSNGHPGSFFEPLGTLPHGGPLFLHFVAWVFVLTHDSVVAMKVVNVLAGTGVVLIGGLLAGRLLGRERMRGATWALALAPTVVWWTVPMLREAISTLLGMGAIYAATFAPRWRALVAMLALLTALAFVRSTLFAAAGAGALAWWLFAALRAHGLEPLVKRVATLVLAAMVVGGVGFYVASGSSGDAAQAVNLTRSTIHSYQQTSHAPTTSAHAPGGTRRPPASETPSSDPSDFQSPFVRSLGGGSIRTYAAAAVRFFVSPRAWAFTTLPLDWYQPLFPAMWLWYLLMPIALFGLWRLRRRPDVLALLGLPIALMAAQYTLAVDSGVRQRAGIEPLVVLLIVAGWSSWAVSLLWGSLVLLVLAPIAALDLHSPLAGLLVGAGALLVFGISRRLAGRGPGAEQPDTLPEGGALGLSSPTAPKRI